MSRQLSFNPRKEYDLIEYPGRVVNPDRMIATLGGIINVSKVNIAILFWPLVLINLIHFPRCLAMK